MRASATEALLAHDGRAVAFTSHEGRAARIDDPEPDLTADGILVLRKAGPRSPSGMPEAGHLPIPGKPALAGVTDMVRIPEARMSGTAFGTIMLHVLPEAAAGGALSLVRNGDRIRLSASARRVDLLACDTTPARRAAEATVSSPVPARGYPGLSHQHVTSATEGFDFGFLGAAAG